MQTITHASESLRAALRAASTGLIEREALVELVALAAVAGEHLLLIGPPGTAKSEVARRAASAVGGRYFEYLLGRFTEPGEIFGPIDLRRLREGVVEVETAGMLPEADVAFLDEVFLGSTAILNTLLGLLNERTFRRGHTALRCPLRVCVAASNALPDDDALAAFADRFLVRAFLDPVPDARLEDMLSGGWRLARDGKPIRASLDDVDTLARAAHDADLDEVRPLLAHAIRMLRKAGVQLSDRRAVRVQRLIAAAAVLAGRTRPTGADLWPLITAVPTREEQHAARQCLRDLLASSDNAALVAATESAAAGPAARARRIVHDAQMLLDGNGTHGGDGVDAGDAWRLKLEGILREIDAGFAAADMPEALATVRTRLIEAVRTTESTR
jgi:MoxR-like ATPase